ncbi:hypothetical protein STENM223S_09746 [Streptomyces tendae]
MSGPRCGRPRSRAPCGPAGRAVRPAGHGPGPADVGRSGVGQQTGLEHHRGEPERGVARDRVEGGDADQVPQRLDGTRRLAVRGQPAAEVLGVQSRIGEVEPLERERGTPHRGAFGEGEVRIGREAAPQVQGHGQRVAPQPAEPAALGPRQVDHGYVEAVLHRRERRSADPVEEPPVGGAAAQVHVLAVVDGEVAALEGEGESAEPWASLSRVTRRPPSASASAVVTPASPPPTTTACPPGPRAETSASGRRACPASAAGRRRGRRGRRGGARRRRRARGPRRRCRRPVGRSRTRP